MIIRNSSNIWLLFKIDGFVARLSGPAALEPSSWESIRSIIELGFKGRGICSTRSVRAKSSEQRLSPSTNRLVYRVGKTVVASSHIPPRFTSSSFSGGGRMSSNSEDHEVVEDLYSKSFSNSETRVVRHDFSELEISISFFSTSFSATSLFICSVRESVTLNPQS